MAKRTISYCIAALAAACSTDAERYDTPLVSEGLLERTGHAIEPAEGPLPASVRADDGVTEDEAVTIALWNNPGFREALAELGLKRADLIQAGLLSNPVLSFLFPLGPKQLEFAVTLPTEILWLRPARLEAAGLDAERVASLLVQDGLNLIRDVRVRYADLEEADERADLTTEIAVLHERLAGLTAARLRAGDASERDLADAGARAREARAAAAAAGQVRHAATVLVKGSKVGELYEGQKIVEVAVWGVPRVRTDLEALRAIPIATPSGARVPLGELADVEVVPAPNTIVREGASRRIDVSCYIRPGFDLGSVAREVERRVRALPFGAGSHPEFLGEYAARQEARNRLLTLTAAALLGILVLLHVDFQSVRLTLLVALTLPFALIGGVLGSAAGGGHVSLGSLVGFVTVLGIAARNGIMLVSHYRHLQEHEGVPFGPELILRGAEERLAPILMTALCAALALLPLVLKGNVPGQEIEYPLAQVILGGLLTSTALNLFLLPALYAAFGAPTVPKS